ncbi:MAG: 5-formyltetrahydrofolate cyclo-ligase [Planctomycetota bacterium]|nr:MAG: 5-formyltetrahydrofolate cyclo-ligase [Planctomycetota bacterium]
MTASGAGDAKRALRRRLRDTLDRLPAEARRDASRAVARRLMGLVDQIAPSVVQVYLALPAEPDVDEVAVGCLRRGLIVAAPRVDWQAGELTPTRVTLDGAGAVRARRGRHGVREPVGPALGAVGGPLLVLVPGLAFDPAGGRLGRGGGFYDRHLAALRRSEDDRTPVTAVGVAFDQQIVPALPMEEHDRPVDVVVTDRRLITATPNTPR